MARSVFRLRSDDFGELRAEWAKTLRPASLTRFMTLVKNSFANGYQAELLHRPARYGGDFDKPSQRTMW